MLERALLLLSPLVFVPFLAIAAWSSRDSDSTAIVHPAIEVEVARADVREGSDASMDGADPIQTANARDLGQEVAVTTGIEAARAKAVGPVIASMAGDDDDHRVAKPAGTHRRCGDKQTGKSRTDDRGSTHDRHRGHDAARVL